MALDAQAFLSALADLTRLRIVFLLHQQGELCVCELVQALDTHQPKVSKHLAVLRKTGIIRTRREGQWIHYRLDPELPTWASNVIRELVGGCERRSDFETDRIRLNSVPPEIRCNTN